MKLLGHIDDIGRPCVYVETLTGDLVLVTVDTGANVYMLLHETDLHVFGTKNIQTSSKIMKVAVTMADGNESYLHHVDLTFVWFSQPIGVTCYVSSGKKERRHPDGPIGIIGTALLKDCRLSIDFVRRTVEIEKLLTIAVHTNMHRLGIHSGDLLYTTHHLGVGPSSNIRIIFCELSIH